MRSLPLRATSPVLVLSLLLLVALAPGITAFASSPPPSDEESMWPTLLSRDPVTREVLEFEARETPAGPTPLRPVPSRDAVLPGPESDLSLLMEPAPEYDRVAQVVANTAGEVAVFWIEDYTLMFRTSADGGATFGPEQRLTGDEQDGQVFDFAPVRTSDRELYVAAIIADSAAGAGVYVYRSTDMGHSWDEAVPVCREGDPGYPAYPHDHDLTVEATAEGQVAIMFASSDAAIPPWTRPYASVSADFGRSWSSPARFASGQYSYGFDIAIVPQTGQVVAAFVDSAFMVFPYWHMDVQCTQVSTTTDNGANWSEAYVLEELFPDYWGGANSIAPEVIVGSDGSINIFGFVRGAGPDGYWTELYRYARSVDDGASFAPGARALGRRSPAGYAVERHERTGTILLAYSDRSAQLRVHRSGDNGISFDDGTGFDYGQSGRDRGTRRNTLASGAPGEWALLRECYGQLFLHRSSDDGLSWDAGTPLRDENAAGRIGWGETIAASGDAAFVAAWADERPRGGVGPGHDIYVNGTEFAGVTGERRLDTDENASAAPTENVVLYQGANGNLRTAFLSDGDVYRAESPDRGRTHEHLAVVSGWPQGARRTISVRAAAAGDAEYLLSSSYGTDRGGQTLHRSLDGGDSFEDIAVDARCAEFHYSRVALAAAPGGRVHVACTDHNAMVVASSHDHGNSFTETVLQAPVSPWARASDFSLCTAADTVIAAWALRSDAAYAAVSTDGGLTFSDPVRLYEPGWSSNSPRNIAALCATDGHRAFVSYSVDSTEFIEILTNRWDRGQGWSELGPAETETRRPYSGTSPLELEFADAAETILLIGYASSDQNDVASPRVTVLRSTDAGSTFEPPVTFPGRFLPWFGLGLRADGEGHVWVYFNASEASRHQLSTARSDDFGATFGPTRRVDIENPRGYFRSRARADGGLVTYPGEAVFAFSASRRGYATSPIVIRDGANAAPVADAGEPQELECTGGGAMATLDGSGSTDPDGAGDIVSYSWSEDSSVFAEGVTVEHWFALGEHAIQLEVADQAGLSDTDTTEVAVIDTLPPSGNIAFPADGSCHGPAAMPVVVEDSFSDRCSAEIDRAYEPGPGPSYAEHGDYTLVLTATDPSGNASEASAAFTIDLEPPQVAVVADTSELAFPMTAAFSDLFATGDADGARGEVVHEVLLLDDCVLHDGNSYGDGDGLLLDEIVVLDQAALCEAARRCGTTNWDDPAVVARATDCGGNSGAAGFVLPGHFSLVEGVCPGN